MAPRAQGMASTHQTTSMILFPMQCHSPGEDPNVKADNTRFAWFCLFCSYLQTWERLQASTI
ncbi:hypothetical protein ZEAMMB73_Zm00001d009139 [Zea mays]|uniref:Uncharacterized protein n=1 Tax=Zea mays TaxID=4577 RepID=A0A1D6FHV5_MAIZE|nr:hypothetical protein ZEAMMB73_Zm00001d009139 [Zea mays]